MVRRATEVLGIEHVARWMKSRIPSLGNQTLQKGDEFFDRLIALRQPGGIGTKFQRAQNGVRPTLQRRA